MTKVTASQFKAELGKYMRTVRAGGSVLVTDRGIPVVLEPVDSRKKTASSHSESERFIMSDPSAPAFGDVVLKGIKYRGPDSLKLLLIDRQR